jgi:transposase
MQSVSQNKPPTDLGIGLGQSADLSELLLKLRDGRPTHRRRALALLAHLRGVKNIAIREFTGLSKGALKRYLRAYEAGGAGQLFARPPPARKTDDESIKKAVFATLHNPPSSFGFNRTTWKMEDLRSALARDGHSVGLVAIRRITKDAGYRWRKARVVLTSNDPSYSEKVQRIRAILSNLRPDEAFFSIDEFGPFAIRLIGGRSLQPPNQQRLVPQWQRSKGKLILTAALELSGNQVTHFYSEKKNTAEMVRMLDALLSKYHEARTIFLSWDAASWHISKALQKRIDALNDENIGATPRVQTAPLPAGAQFLNVIESVFSGMARAVIHNSNYKDVDEARAAIDRYFADRNSQFRENPRRAGRKIWGTELEPAVFSEGNNCKDPQYFR